MASSNLKDKIKAYFTAPDFMKRFIVMMVGVFLMGFFLTFLVKVDLGTDPCTFMNLSVSNRLPISFGTWQLVLNSFLFIFVILFDIKKIGPGTLANMTLIGYIVDFFSWIFSKTIPEYYFTTFPYRGVIFVAALILFIISVSFYINANMGVSPYDAMPQIISDRVLKKVPFKFVRMGYDFLVIGVGMIFGGKPNIGIVLMALFLGPVISYIGGILNKHVFHLMEN